jgi:hypothetical protein
MSLEALLSACVADLDDAATVAIGLTGSHTRDNARRYSDVDLWHFVQTVPDEPFVDYTLRQEGDFLVSVTVATLQAQREKMTRPAGALSAVPGLRQTRILLDKTGELAALVQAARDFQWASVAAEANRYASYDLMGNAEEAHKIMNGLDQADDYLLVYGVTGLVLGLSHTVALFKGVLSESENTYWRDVQVAVGLDSQWTHEQRLALGLVLASPRMRGIAGLRLYRETAALLESVILPEHEPVIASTLKRLSHFVD